ncbi:hypothetical protein CJF32_00007227 [Rutstroemia sp. NJR-2017a WRK4]|nr:hypothetical protein CJF32_00007227 [Rutstroemia sp. NJR-2017a WRK4]
MANGCVDTVFSAEGLRMRSSEGRLTCYNYAAGASSSALSSLRSPVSQHGFFLLKARLKLFGAVPSSCRSRVAILCGVCLSLFPCFDAPDIVIGGLVLEVVPMDYADNEKQLHS